MLKFDQFQVDAMATAFSSTFIEQTIAHIRAHRALWAQERSDADIAAHIEKITEFASKHGVFNASSLQRLAVMKIDLDFDPDPRSYSRTLLRSSGFSEAERLDAFDRARQATCQPEPIV